MFFMSYSNKLLGNFYSLHFDELSRFLSRRVSTPDSAAELTQDVFVRLAEKGEGIDSIRHPRGYLYRSAKNMAVDAWRVAEEQATVVFEDDAVLDAVDSPETILQHRETLAVLLEAIENLPPRCREVFLLHRFEEMSYPAIAERLGISVSAVEKQMMRAMKACRHALEPARRGA
jgi:RNA polymerase sigma factor (sigma-70 family)